MKKKKKKERRDREEDLALNTRTVTFEEGIIWQRQEPVWAECENHTKLEQAAPVSSHHTRVQERERKK